MIDLNISPIVKEMAPKILASIAKAKSILLHCHPSPDPDSVGSALAMKFALEQLGKKATVIKGDSDIPQAFMHFPGAKDIVEKNLFEVDLKEFDLFIAVDSASPSQISRFKTPTFPLSIKTIVIDHHFSNKGYADINLIEASYPATGLILYDLFKEWQVNLGEEGIASDLFMGIYADTGGFKYSGVNSHTYEVAAKLVKSIPDVSKLIMNMEFSNTRGLLDFEAAALSKIEVIGSGQFAISTVPYSVLKEKNIPATDARTSEVSSFMLTVAEWQVTASVAELQPNVIKFSFRSKDIDKYDVAKLTALLGGGGHRAAAGLILKMPLEEAKKLVVSKAKELYNL